MSAEEMRQRGWEWVDIVFVTGDAYVDHPSFAMAIVHRVLEAAGFASLCSVNRTGVVVNLAAVRASAAVLRHQCRQHGFDDQSLHREQEGT
jgi:hypothetical protein